LQETWKGAAKFLAVYISEAHAQDEWPLGNIVCLNQHKTMEERLEVAKTFKEKYDFQIPLLVDTMENTLDNKYACWPERFFIIQHGVMKLVGSPTTEYGYDRESISRWLSYYCQTATNTTN